MKTPEINEPQPSAAEPAFLYGISVATRATVLSTGLKARVDENIFLNRDRKNGGAPRLYRPGRPTAAGAVGN